MATRLSELSSGQLRWTCDPDSLEFETTADVPPLVGMSGQGRAASAINLGLHMETDGYNLFGVGAPGTGKHTTVCERVGAQAARRPAPDDWCYTYNFSEPNCPQALRLPAGQGRKLRVDMEKRVEECERELVRAFDGEDYRQRREAELRQFEQRKEQLQEALQQKARERGLLVQATAVGIVTVPMLDDPPVSPEQFQQLPEKQRRAFERSSEELQEQVRAVLAQHQRLDKEAAERVAQLDRQIGLFAIGHLVDDLRPNYAGNQQVLACLDQVLEDIVEHLQDFRLREREREHAHSPSELHELEQTEFADRFVRYRVNVVVDNSHAQGAPVVCENNPTYHNLMRRIDYRPRLGAMVTDFTMIKAGALQRANGCYLVVRARDVLANPFSWDGLKRALRTGNAQIENLGKQLTLIPTATLRPEPIPIDVKVVLLGNQRCITCSTTWTTTSESCSRSKLTSTWRWSVPPSTCEGTLHS